MKSKLFLLCTASLLATPYALSEDMGLNDPLLGDNDLPIALTPARLAQPRTEVPTSLTVLDQHLIENSGIREVHELMRLVPGMAVASRDGWNHVVSYHGTSYRDSRRMQVLIDGRSIYQAGLATIDWSSLPIGVQDIARIEINRGPNTAAYGANAFLGVINIITKNPRDSERFQLSALAGSGDTDHYTAQISHSTDQTAWRISAHSRADRGFDHNEEGEERRDGKRTQSIDLRGTIQLNEFWELDFSAGAVSGFYQEDRNEIMQNMPEYEIDDEYVAITLDRFEGRHHLKMAANYTSQYREYDWISCIPTAALGLSGLIEHTLCGTADDNTRNTRSNIDLQYAWSNGDSLQMVVGSHLQAERVESQTFYGGTIEQNGYQLFGNVTWNPNDAWTLNLGASQEYEEDNGKHFTPRISLHHHITHGHSLRFVWSKAIRTPDLLEQKADWSYTLYNIGQNSGGIRAADYFMTALAKGNLKEEEIISREWGYLGYFADKTLMIDIKLFRDSMADLIYQQLDLDDFNPSNLATLDQKGAEIEVEYQPNNRFRVRGSYAYIDSDHERFYYQESELTPHHSGSLLMIWSPDQGWHASAGFYYAEPIHEMDYRRGDLNLGYRWRFSDHSIDVTTTLEHRFDDEGNLFDDNLYRNQNRYFVRLTLNY